MLLNVDQLQKQLDKDEFQEDRSMAAFWVVNNQFQKFINSKFTLDYDSQMTDTYFVEYTGLEVQHFKDTLLQTPGCRRKRVRLIQVKHWMLIWLTQKALGQTQQCKDDISRSGMIQRLDDAVDADINPYITKSNG
ncbi:hypothetical protein Tco_0115950 [Tanacetum coccineum]